MFGLWLMSTGMVKEVIGPALVPGLHLEMITTKSVMGNIGGSLVPSPLQTTSQDRHMQLQRVAGDANQ